jgi:hypothetical protein
MEGTTVLEGAATALWAYKFQPLGFLGLRIEDKHIVHDSVGCAQQSQTCSD